MFEWIPCWNKRRELQLLLALDLLSDKYLPVRFLDRCSSHSTSWNYNDWMPPWQHIIYTSTYWVETCTFKGTEGKWNASDAIQYSSGTEVGINPTFSAIHEVLPAFFLSLREIKLMHTAVSLIYMWKLLCLSIHSESIFIHLKPNTAVRIKNG